MNKSVFFFSGIIALCGCSSSSTIKPLQAVISEPHKAHAEQGLYFMQTGMLLQAITEFDEAIKHCEVKYPADGKKVYTSRTTAESLMYAVLSSSRDESVDVVDTVCSDAYYLRGFTAMNTGRLRDAEGYLHKAVSMAPVNAMYLSALGHIYQVKRDWQQAIDYFAQAEDAAKTYSPEQVRISEFSRAKRGIGFNLIQLGKLNEAEAKYKECLAIDAKDKGALNELEYINKLREQNNL
ncbi:tetratricopeptide repeat protein [Cellvibrio mixtus]|uniref:tetratricopeptide repeat protein n=1 Tax=Cellvibrio mixtus TaxID=39650 RepID=UPI00058784DF|nr:tetratricopeptide repeat protein [Cellvibrio mixtus]